MAGRKRVFALETRPSKSCLATSERKDVDARVKPGHDGGEDDAQEQLADDPHDVGLLHDQKLLAIELDLGPGPFSEQHAVSGLDLHRDELAVVVAPAGAHGYHLALLRFFLG